MKILKSNLEKVEVFNLLESKLTFTKTDLINIIKSYGIEPENKEEIEWFDEYHKIIEKIEILKQSMIFTLRLDEEANES